MAKAGFCSECNANVWVNEDGSCVNGHAAGAVSGVYETGQPVPVPAPAPSAPKKSRVGITIAVVLAVVLLLACVVGGIVASVSLPIFNAASSSARQKACFANQRTVEGAVEQYMAAGPESVRPSGPIDASSVLLTDGYIVEVPKCALGDEPYVYDAETRLATCPYGDPPAGHGHF